MKEILFRHFSLHVRKLRPWEDCDLPKDPKSMMGPEPNHRAPNSLPSVISTHVGLLEGVGIKGVRGILEGGGKGSKTAADSHKVLQHLQSTSLRHLLQGRYYFHFARGKLRLRKVQ